MVPLLNSAPTLVSQSPTLNRPHSVLRLVALPGLLRSLPAQDPVLLATGTLLNGQAGFPPAQLVFPVLLAAGLAPAHGVSQVTGAVMVVLVVPVALVALVDLAHGAQKPAASTATHGQHGPLDGDPSPLGLAHGLAAAQPPPLLFLLPSPLPLQPVARLKSSRVPPSVSRLWLLLPLPPVARVTALRPFVALVRAVH